MGDTRWPLVLALAAILAVGGCLTTTSTSESQPADEDEPAPDPERPEVSEPELATPTRVSETNVAEPAAIAAPDGTFYVLDFTELHRSTDGGETFTEMEVPFEDRGDSDLLVGPEGGLHYVGMGIEGDPKLPYHVRANGSWQDVRELAPDSASVDRPWIERGEDGRLVVTWNDHESEENKVRVSDDGGRTWSQPTVLPDPMAYLVGPPVVHGDLVLQPWRRGGDLLVALSTDGGQTWGLRSGPDVGGHGVGFPAMAVDEAGTVYLAAAQDPEASGGDDVHPRIHVWSSSDLGASWTSAGTVDAGEGLPTREPTAVFPWIEAGAPGRVAVSFYEDVTGTSPEDSAGAWYPALAVTNTADRNETDWVGVHLTDQPVKNGSMCASGTGCSSGDWRFRDYFEMDLGPGGRPAVAFVRDTAPASPRSVPAPVEVVFTRVLDGWSAAGTE